MTRRTRTTSTTIYRRHAASCPYRDQPLNLASCECLLWIHGKVRGKIIRHSLDTRFVGTAEMRQANLEAGHDDDPEPGGPKLVGPRKGNETLEYATQEYLKTTTELAHASQVAYAATMQCFGQWAADRGLVMLQAIESAHIREFILARREWKSRHTRQAHLRRLSVFFNFCKKQRRWIAFPPTEDPTLNQRGKKARFEVARQPFTPEEIARILAAVERVPQNGGRGTHRADKRITYNVRDRARALVNLLLYTGMRISDATFCERAALASDNMLHYIVIKTGKPIDIPPELQPAAVEALAKLPPSRIYFFQPDREDDYRDARCALQFGEGDFSRAMPNYSGAVYTCYSLVKRVLALAGLPGACHRFRDTFAVNLLVGGTDIYTVSKMLGHSDVRITDQHYMKLVPGYREKLSQSTRVLTYHLPSAV